MTKSIMAVYRDVLRNAEYFRDMAIAARKIGTIGSVNQALHCENIAHELSKVAADMERIKEINPPKPLKK